MAEQKEVANGYEGLKTRRKELQQLYNDYTSTLKKQHDDWNGAIDALVQPATDFNDAWDKASPERRTEMANQIGGELPERADELEAILRQLRNAPDKAWRVIGSCITMLVILSACYLYLHITYRTTFNDVDVREQLFTELGTIKREFQSTQPDWKRIHNAVSDLPSPRQTKDLLVAELDTRLSLLRGMLRMEPVAPKKEEKTGDKKENSASGQPAAESQPVKDLADVVNKLEKDATALAGNDGFFWVGGGWRWLEIVFWGEFGVLVGILVWVSGRASKALYTNDMYTREQYWYLAEVFIGPIVVVAVFFLLRQFVTVILTGVTEAEVRASIYLTLGISFTLGLFVRRTLGIFNVIKSKLPLPGS